MEGRPPEVSLDDGDTLAVSQEGDGEVCDGRGLALAGQRTGDGDNSRVVVEVDELEVRAKEAIRLRRNALWLAEGDKPSGGGLLASVQLGDGGDDR